MQLRCSELSPSTTRFTSVILWSDQLSISARGRSRVGFYLCSCLVTSSAGFSCLMYSARGARRTVMLGASWTHAAWLTWRALLPGVSGLWARQPSTVQSSPRSHSAGATMQRGGTRPGRPGVKEEEPLLRERVWRTCLQISLRLWCGTSRTHGSVRFAWIARLRPPSVLVATWFVAWIAQPCARNAHYVVVRLRMHNESSFLVSKKTFSDLKSGHLSDRLQQNLVQLWGIFSYPLLSKTNGGWPIVQASRLPV